MTFNLLPVLLKVYSLLCSHNLKMIFSSLGADYILKKQSIKPIFYLKLSNEKFLSLPKL